MDDVIDSTLMPIVHPFFSSEFRFRFSIFSFSVFSFLCKGKIMALSSILQLLYLQRR